MPNTNFVGLGMRDSFFFVAMVKIFTIVTVIEMVSATDSHFPN